MNDLPPSHPTPFDPRLGLDWLSDSVWLLALPHVRACAVQHRHTKQTSAIVGVSVRMIRGLVDCPDIPPDVAAHAARVRERLQGLPEDGVLPLAVLLPPDQDGGSDVLADWLPLTPSTP